MVWKCIDFPLIFHRFSSFCCKRNVDPGLPPETCSCLCTLQNTASRACARGNTGLVFFVSSAALILNSGHALLLKTANLWLWRRSGASNPEYMSVDKDESLVGAWRSGLPSDPQSLRSWDDFILWHLLQSLRCVFAAILLANSKTSRRIEALANPGSESGSSPQVLEPDLLGPLPDVSPCSPYLQGWVQTPCGGNVLRCL